MPRTHILLLFILAFTGVQARTTLEKSQLELADPFILLEGDTYYAYGTHSPEGFQVYASKDLRTWEYRGMALHKDSTTAKARFWAPEVYKRGDTFYLFFTGLLHLYVATAKSPVGPFSQPVRVPIYKERAIDASLTFDDDGTPWLFFARLIDGNTIYSARMNDSLTHVLPETVQYVTSVSQPWETDPKYPDAKIAEGPFAIKVGNTWALTYSANDCRSQNYGIGLLTSNSLAGPWKKQDNSPIFQNAYGMMGTAHHAFFRDKHGRLHIVFHAHNSPEQMGPRLLYIARAKFKQRRDGSLTFKYARRPIVPKVIKKTSL